MSQTLLVAVKETDVELNAETTNRVFMSWEQNTGKCKNTKSGNKPVKILASLRYLGTTLKHQHCVHE
jgi:hypothetical protein